MKYLRRALGDDSGVSLPEMIVGIALSMIVTSLVVSGLIGVLRAQNVTSQDSEALSGLRVAADRLGKELRQARKVYNTAAPLNSGARKLVIWVDYDLDNQQDLSEKITWEVVADGSKARLTRSTQELGGGTQVIARNFVMTDAFVYTPTLATATSVTITFSADPAGTLTPARTIRTQIRLRNATFD